MTKGTIKLFHYTDKIGYDTLTSGHVEWYPSLGISRRHVKVISRHPIPGLEHLFPKDFSHFEETSADAISFAGTLAAVNPFISAFTTGNPLMPPTTLVNNIRYGPGWYATDLTPDTKTQKLLKALWQGNAENLHKTAFWLQIAVKPERIDTPDKERPNVKFIPIVNNRRMRGDPPKPFGQSTSSVYLLEAGSRVEVRDGEVKINHLYKPSSPIELIKPFMFLIDGFSSLSPDMQDNVRRYFGIDNSE